MSLKDSAIEALLREGRRFDPPADFQRHARIKDTSIYEEGDSSFPAFWETFARELDWIRPWDKVLHWDPPHAQWFVGGKINVSYNCIDRHLKTARKNKAALIWEGEPGDTRVLTYQDLYREVCRCANALKSLGVRKGDRVTMYLPMIPELPIAMLACARIGAVHNVVFGGFSPTAVAQRMNDAGSRILITCDGYYRRGNIVNQKQRADEAAALVDQVKHMVVVRRTGDSIPWNENRDHWWHELMSRQPMDCTPEAMDAEDMLFIMYTSGTTGRPKGVVHTTGGYLTGVYATFRSVFDIKEEDTYWCMADIGWITGHSYIVYGPLSCGSSVVMYEGAPDWPDVDRPWAIIEKYRVNILYTAPTAIRGFMRHGPEHPQRYDLSSLRLLGSVGEPINPEAWIWYHKYIGGERCPIVDTWWQTETGMILITPLPGVTTTKPGSATRPFPGIKATVLDDAGNPVPPGKGGYLAITRPWPAMLRTIWGDDERYIREYWSKWKNDIYYPGDVAYQDEDGYFWIVGRVDDVINVAGHRLSTMELESALVSHPAVAEAAVIGASDELRGQVPIGFVILEEGHAPSPELRNELVRHVSDTIGPIARPKTVVFTPELPKTRSGKIMRRLLSDIVESRPLGDTTTLRNPEIAQEIQQIFKETVTND